MRKIQKLWYTCKKKAVNAVKCKKKSMAEIVLLKCSLRTMPSHFGEPFFIDAFILKFK